MKIRVLGSAAGGGFPQWNCNCRNCNGVRNGTVRARARTQSSIAVTANELDWALINASPDILSQIAATPALQPGRSPRDTGIVAVVLMDAQIDHVTGLLMLREGKTLSVHCTASVWKDLTHGLALTRVLSHYCDMQWNPIDVDEVDGARSTGTPFTLPRLEGIRFTPVPLSSKAPPYSEHRMAPTPGDNIGLLIENEKTGRSLFYAPGLGQIEPHVESAMRTAECVLVDGTFWRGDEMIHLGLSAKTAADMGHLPQSGPGGMIELMGSLEDRRKILIHINNTNPILDDDSRERATLARHGIELAYDGMEINL
ncbi:pyrroloquinoline quinone biosynthesis protein PqqB [Noviherbaspirillum saxi]|uniref:Coenzyme PQQ synthesis protein B n=1 Tax=Noviherbaspirillum saxi TaxID=2320863 RepID=A0A3A3G0F8_9BURK|nr:pyrroloquinoline quinone biosynthesis protein PqqB [Noviherbaspirillum saxi]RJF92809.1 pyrroloquinoline quinone biosynthesis protein PqqB [Noviherbaspirillum saxi]